MIEPDINVVLVLLDFGLGEEVGHSEDNVATEVGERPELGKSKGQWVELALGNDVERLPGSVVGERDPAYSCGAARTYLAKAGIEELSHKSRPPVAVGPGLGRVVDER